MALYHLKKELTLQPHAGHDLSLYHMGHLYYGQVLSQAVKSQIYEDIVTTGHHSASLAAEVWRAANAYCKAHKLAHPELTAQGKLLSNFVNADPDSYCSLPLTATPEALSAMPTRWLVNNANSYFNTNLSTTNDTILRIKFYFDHYGINLIGRYVSGSNFSITPTGANKLAARFNTNGYITASDAPTPSVHQVLDLVLKNNEFTVNEVSSGFSKGSMSNNGAFVIFGLNIDGSISASDAGTKIANVDLENMNDNKDHNFIPSKISNTMELLDLETLTLATRVGTFTEQKDIPIS